MSTLIQQKVEQAAALLRALNIDAWLSFTRESDATGEPVIPLILGLNLTWPSALIVTKSGDTIAIVGKGDHEAVESTGAWREVVPYVKSVRDPLREALARVAPASLALNTSRDEPLSDGLSHGMFLLLREYLADTAWLNNVVSADPIITPLRTRKSPEEVRRLREAARLTQEAIAEVGRFARPGTTEREIAGFMREWAHTRRLAVSWAASSCPIVNAGPHSMFGHGVASELALEPGHVLHIDFGVKSEGYCGDLQRCWYVPHAGESRPPEAVQRAFDAVVSGIRAAAEKTRAGVTGIDVDRAARDVITGAGFPEFEHATGHHVGLFTHDGGGTLGPMWERYGERPKEKLEPGNVVTLEPSIRVVGEHGGIGVEEMALVSNGGCEFLSTPQTTLPLLGR